MAVWAKASVHNIGAKYGFSISERRNRNTWLSLEITETTDGLIKDHVGYVMLKFVCSNSRDVEKNSVGQNGNYPDLGMYSHSQLRAVPHSSNATIYQSAGGDAVHTFSCWNETIWHKRISLLFWKSVFHQRCADMPMLRVNLVIWLKQTPNYWIYAHCYARIVPNIKRSRNFYSFVLFCLKVFIFGQLCFHLILVANIRYTAHAQNSIRHTQFFRIFASLFFSLLHGSLYCRNVCVRNILRYEITSYVWRLLNSMHFLSL